MRKNTSLTTTSMKQSTTKNCNKLARTRMDSHSCGMKHRTLDKPLPHKLSHLRKELVKRELINRTYQKILSKENLKGYSKTILTCPSCLVAWKFSFPGVRRGDYEDKMIGCMGEKVRNMYLNEMTMTSFCSPIAFGLIPSKG